MACQGPFLVSLECRAFPMALDENLVTSRSSVLITFLLTEEAGVMGEDGLSFHGTVSHKSYSRESI